MSPDVDAETIRDHVEADLGDDWDLRGLSLASDDDEGRVYLLVFRTTTSDRGNLILSERYYRYDPVSRSGQWLDNGIERRMTGSMAPALAVLYSAINNGDAEPSDPMLLDSRDSQLDHSADALTTPLDDLDDDLQPLDTAADQQGIADADEGETVETGVCDECGAERPREQLATVTLGDMESAICRGECVGDADDEGDDADVETDGGSGSERCSPCGTELVEAGDDRLECPDCGRWKRTGWLTLREPRGDQA